MPDESEELTVGTRYRVIYRDPVKFEERELKGIYMGRRGRPHLFNVDLGDVVIERSIYEDELIEVNKVLAESGC